MTKKFIKYYLLAAVFLASIVALTFYFKSSLEEKILTTIEKDLQKTLKVNAEAVIQWLNDQENSARLIASRPELKAIVKQIDQETASTVKSLDDYMQGVLQDEYSSFNEYFILKSHSDHYEINLGSSVVLTESIRNNLKQLEKGKTFIQLPFIHKEEEHRKVEMFIATPVLNTSGQKIAVLGLLLDPKLSFSRIMTASRFGTSAETFAINTKQQMISESRFLDTLTAEGKLGAEESNILNININLPFRKSIIPYPSSQVSNKPYISYTGSSVIGASTFVPKYDFAIISEISEEEAYEPLQFFRKVYLIILIIILTLSLSLLLLVLFSLSLRKKALQKLKKIGNYQIFQKIGEGALGVVYEGKHQHLQRKTALKVLKPEVCTEESIKSFKNEVQLSSRLNHPNTISIYDYGRTDNNLFYYAMEFVNGMDLSAFQKITGPIHFERCIYLLKQVCSSLKEAHEMGLVHRDIKPHNIMICNQGGISDFIKVLDFGLVMDFHKQNNNDTLSGTPLYMAPETVLNSGQVDSRADIYSFGVMAFYMLTGKYPIGDKSFTPVEILKKQINDKPHNLSELMSGQLIPIELYNLINQCLEKDPDLRPQSVNEISKRLTDSQRVPWTEELATFWWRNNPYMLTQELKHRTTDSPTLTNQINSTQLSLTI